MSQEQPPLRPYRKAKESLKKQDYTTKGTTNIPTSVTPTSTEKVNIFADMPLLS